MDADSWPFNMKTTKNLILTQNHNSLCSESYKLFWGSGGLTGSWGRYRNHDARFLGYNCVVTDSKVSTEVRFLWFGTYGTESTGSGSIN